MKGHFAERSSIFQCEIRGLFVVVLLLSGFGAAAAQKTTSTNVTTIVHD